MRSGLMVLLAMATACSRSFSAPVSPHAPPPSGLGAGCAAAGECGSGLCIDGVCCASACEADQVCNDPRSLGHCRQTQLGDACTSDARCGSGHCVDGVCCDIACEGDCQSCALPGFIGQCEPVPENTDPRQRCGGACKACRDGSCGPAVVGTNPEHGCQADLVCGAFSICGAFDGGGCIADADCALGRCLDGRCLQVHVQEVYAPPMLPAGSSYLYRSVAGVARGLDQQTAVLFTEAQAGASDDTPTLRDLMLALVDRDSATQVVDLLGDRGTDLDGIYASTPIVAAVEEFEGGYYVVAAPSAADYTDCTTGPTRACTVVGWRVSADGRTGPREVVGQQPLGFGFYSMRFAVLDGGPVVAFNEFLEAPDGGFPIVRELDRRLSDGGWVNLRYVDEPDPLEGIEQTATGVWLVGFSGSTDLYIERLDGSARSTHALSPRCSGASVDDLVVSGRSPPGSPTLLDLDVFEGCTLDAYANSRPLHHLTVDTADPDAPLWSADEDAGIASEVAVFPGFGSEGAELVNLRLEGGDDDQIYGKFVLRTRSSGGPGNAYDVFGFLGRAWAGPMQVGVGRSNLPAAAFSPTPVRDLDHPEPRLELITVDR